MKFSSVLSVFTVAVASSSALSVDLGYRLNGQAPLVTLDTPIPGDSPVVLCSDPAKDLVTIDKVDIDPNPPVAGKTLHIEASGTVKERIEEGSTLFVEVKLGYIILIKKTFDFCEQIKNVDMECPIEEGPITVIKDVELPSEIPPGKFLVTAKLFNQNKEQITCLKAQVAFAR